MVMVQNIHKQTITKNIKNESNQELINNTLYSTTKDGKAAVGYNSETQRINVFFIRNDYTFDLFISVPLPN